MNGAGRVIHAAVWARGGQRGPGGSAIRSTIRRTAKKLSAARPRRRYDALGPAETRGRRIGGLNRLRLPRPSRAAPRPGFSSWSQTGGRTDHPARATRDEQPTPRRTARTGRRTAAWVDPAGAVAAGRTARLVC